MPEDAPPSVSVLIVDDDEAHAEALRDGLERVGHSCEVADGRAAALAALDRSRFDVVLTDLVMRDGSGLDVLRAARERDPEAAVVLVTGHGTVESAVAAMKEGAVDYLAKPVQIEELRVRVAKAASHRALRRENEELHRELDRRYGFEGIIGLSPPMQRLFETLQQISPTDATVLILGESGTGKELVARAIHANSPRRQRPFVAINCAALSEGLIESELFGHERGAFTGATAPREGKLEYASKGTLFLDEVGDMPLPTQTKFLRALEQREVVRVGANRPIPVDFRLIAATNQPLRGKVQEGKFREDLFFRIAVVQLHLVPLRERRSDIPVLIDHFISEMRTRHGKKVTAISPAARAVLLRHDWPGNVRELRNVIETMVVTTKSDVLDVADVPAPIQEAASALAHGAPPSASLANRSLEDIEREAIAANLALVDGNREKVAQILGIGERTLYRKLKQYGLS
ncbi:MAG TPA: sigma-54 dependent transcriptional regulator [Planctomycetota bacterium]|nr:sigma-54 dependent transcriptional regulator [Planctomycetota bacterium]